MSGAIKKFKAISQMQPGILNKYEMIHTLKNIKIWIMLLLGTLSSSSLMATHIVGGQMYYKCLGNNWYEITLQLRRDCFLGDPRAPFDQIANVGVFDGNGNPVQQINGGVLPFLYMGDSTIKEPLPNSCTVISREVCVHQATYRYTVQLHPQYVRGNGYILAYQRCCRNVTLNNISEQDSTGTTLTVEISPFAQELDSMGICNSQPVFKEWPKIFACSDEDIFIDHSASDTIDSDSLVYALVTPYAGGSHSDNKPGKPGRPPYTNDTVVWRAPYSLDDLIGGVPPLTIDPNTGIITGGSGAPGQYLIGVELTEYRDGKVLSKVRRDFQINILACIGGPEAEFETEKDSCDNGLTVEFINTSRNADRYLWYFDYPSKQDSSTEENPVFTFPERGKYNVMLIAFQDTLCVDTFMECVVLHDPQLMPDFSATSTCEDSLVLTLSDSSKGTHPIVDWMWTIDIGDTTYTASGKDVSILIHEEGEATINLKITDSVGCMADTTKVIDLDFIDIRFFSDTIRICEGDSAKLIANPDSTLTYEWKPATGLNLEKPWDPWAKPDTTTKYVLCVSDSICTVMLDVCVIVEPRQTVTISGDTANCTGKFILIANSDESDIFEWACDSNFTEIIGTGDTIMVMVDSVKTICVRTGVEGECRGISCITLYNRGVCLEDYEKEIGMCLRDTLCINLTPCNLDDNFFVQWDDHDAIITGTDSLRICILPDSVGTFKFPFMIANQYGCILRDTICVTVSEKPCVDFEFESECNDPVVKFTITECEAQYYRWDFGDGNTGTGGPMIEHEYEKSGKYTVKLTAGNDGCDTMITKDVIVVFFELDDIDTILVLCPGTGNMIELNPGGNECYKYKWTPGEFLDDSTAINPKATITEPTKFKVVVMDSFYLPSCMDSICVNVVIPPSVDLKITTEDTLLCNQDSAILTVMTSNPNAELTWCDKDGNVIGTGPTVVVYPPLGRTCYFVKGIDELGCLSMDSICVERYELDYDLMYQDDVCAGDSIMVMITNMDVDTLIINGMKIGQGEKVTIFVLADSSRFYEFDIYNQFGCLVTASVFINVFTLEVEATAEPNTITCGSSSQLNVTSGPGWTYMWTPEGSLSDPTIPNPTATPGETTIYTVKVTDENGCMDTDTTMVEVIQTECTPEFVFLPNAFSPNGDGENDILYLRSSILIEEMDLMIYNRWGEQVFRTQSQAQGWDGTFKGKALAPDVFSYYLRVQCLGCDGQAELVQKGNITLLK
jgi:gliding motility-associated-like protein